MAPGKNFGRFYSKWMIGTGKYPPENLLQRNLIGIISDPDRIASNPEQLVGV